MKTYFANMSVNNGTHYRHAWKGTNNQKLAKEISASARANCLVYNKYSWMVWDENGIIVAAGAGYKRKNDFYYLCMSHLIGQHV